MCCTPSFFVYFLRVKRRYFYFILRFLSGFHPHFFPFFACGVSFFSFFFFSFSFVQSVRSDMDAGRAAAGLPVADWSADHMINVRLVVDVLTALGLVKADYNTAEQASSGWPMDVHPRSEAHGG